MDKVAASELPKPPVVPKVKRRERLILIRNSHESVRDCDVPDIMECGGKRSATPLCRKCRRTP
jgi:hypothetical protein